MTFNGYSPSNYNQPFYQINTIPPPPPPQTDFKAITQTTYPAFRTTTIVNTASGLITSRSDDVYKAPNPHSNWQPNDGYQETDQQSKGESGHVYNKEEMWNQASSSGSKEHFGRRPRQHYSNGPGPIRGSKKDFGRPNRRQYINGPGPTSGSKDNFGAPYRRQNSNGPGPNSASKHGTPHGWQYSYSPDPISGSKEHFVGPHRRQYSDSPGRISGPKQNFGGPHRQQYSDGPGVIRNVQQKNRVQPKITESNSTTKNYDLTMNSKDVDMNATECAQYMNELGIGIKELEKLPEDILIKFQKSMCKLCHVNFDNGLSLAAVHYQSENHAQTVSEWFLKHCPTKNELEKRGIRERIVCCELCNVEFKTNLQMGVHYNSKAHSAIVTGNMPPKNAQLLLEENKELLRQLIEREKLFYQTGSEAINRTDSPKSQHQDGNCQICHSKKCRGHYGQHKGDAKEAEPERPVWWDEEVDYLRKRTRQLFNRAKSANDKHEAEYRQSLKDYKKLVRRKQRQEAYNLRQKEMAEAEKTPSKILVKDSDEIVTGKT